MTGADRRKTTVVMQLDAAPSRNGTRASPRVRASDGQPVRMTSVHLPIALIIKLNVEAAERETSVSAVIEQAVLAHFAAGRRTG